MPWTLFTFVLCFCDLQVVFCGMMSSSGLWGSICDKYGRKTVSVSDVLGCGAVYVTSTVGRR